MGLRWASKSPTEVVERLINWSGLLNGDYIATHSLTVDTGTLTLDSVAFGTELVTVWISGGIDDETVVLLDQITTGDGRTLQQIITIEVIEATIDTAPELPSTATKRTILDMMFEEAGLAGYVFDRTPAQDNSALRKLDGMMAEWEVQGIRLNYNFPSSFGQGDPDETSGIPDWAINAAALGAAFRVFPGMGKTASPETRAALNSGMILLRAQTAVIPNRGPADGTPRGSGNKPWSTWYPFIRREA